MCVYTSHHVRPRSRGGKTGKTVDLPAKFHEAWHRVFSNLYGSECECFLQLVLEAMSREGKITPDQLEAFRNRACRFERR